VKDLTVAALITNFNTWPLAKRCAEALVRASGERMRRVVIVDDASPGPIPDGLPEKVEVLRNERNAGYVRSVNRGFSVLEEDIVLLFDSDAYPLTDLTEPALEAFRGDVGLGAMGFRAVGSDGRPTGAARAAPGIPGFLVGQRAEAAMTRASRPDMALAANLCLYSFAIAVRNEAFRDAGGFDECFDFTDADLDFSMRLRAKGWQVRMRDDIPVFHEGGGSPQGIAARVYRQHKSRWVFLKRHASFFCPFLVKSLLALRHLAECIVLGMAVALTKGARAGMRDKLCCRKRLLSGVWSGYGNELQEGT